jgi:hypothetical protein
MPQHPVLRIGQDRDTVRKANLVPPVISENKRERKISGGDDPVNRANSANSANSAIPKPYGNTFSGI